MAAVLDVVVHVEVVALKHAVRAAVDALAHVVHLVVDHVQKHVVHHAHLHVTVHVPVVVDAVVHAILGVVVVVAHVLDDVGILVLVDVLDVAPCAWDRVKQVVQMDAIPHVQRRVVVYVHPAVLKHAEPTVQLDVLHRVKDAVDVLVVVIVLVLGVLDVVHVLVHVPDAVDVLVIVLIVVVETVRVLVMVVAHHVRKNVQEVVVEHVLDVAGVQHHVEAHVVDVVVVAVRHVLVVLAVRVVQRVMHHVLMDVLDVLVDVHHVLDVLDVVGVHLGVVTAVVWRVPQHVQETVRDNYSAQLNCDSSHLNNTSLIILKIKEDAFYVKC